MTKIEGTAEAWESGLLGNDEEFVGVVELDDALLDKSLSLKSISIRTHKDLKALAEMAKKASDDESDQACG